MFCKRWRTQHVLNNAQSSNYPKGTKEISAGRQRLTEHPPGWLSKTSTSGFLCKWFWNQLMEHSSKGQFRTDIIQTPPFHVILLHAVIVAYCELVLRFVASSTQCCLCQEISLWLLYCAPNETEWVQQSFQHSFPCILFNRQALSSRFITESSCMSSTVKSHSRCRKSSSWRMCWASLKAQVPSSTATAERVAYRVKTKSILIAVFCHSIQDKAKWFAYAAMGENLREKNEVIVCPMRDRVQKSKVVF